MSRPKTNRSIRRGQMRSQLIGQNCPNKEAPEVRRNSEKQQKQENKKKTKKMGEGNLELDGTVRNQTAAIKIGR